MRFGSVVVVLAVLGLGGALGWSDEGYVHIDFMVPQSAADFIRIGHDVTLFDEGAGYTPTVSAIDSQADRSTRNRLVRAVLEPVPPTLLPGDSVRGLVEYGPPQNTAAVPVEAIRRAPVKTFV